MDAYPEERERVLARWTFMGAMGDFAAPALIGAYALVSLGWRAAFITSGLFIAAYALVVARQRFPEHPTTAPTEAEQEAPGIRAALGMALRDRTLLVWLFGCWLCSLLDEILVAFGALFMRDELGAGPAERSAILMAFMAGGMVGLLVLERLLARVDPLRMLRAAALGSAIAYAAWLSVRSPVASAFWMFLTGLFSSSLYPIAKAQAYRALPGRSGMLNAVAHLFTPLDFLLPMALGLIADRFGLVAALTVLIAQPVGLFVIAARRSS